MNASPQIARVATVAATALAFCVLVLVPGERKLKTARGATQSLRDAIAAESIRYLSLEGLNQEVQRLRRGTRDFEDRVPTDHRLGDFLRDLAAVLQRSGMENHILQPRPVQAVLPQQLPAGCESQFAALRVQPVLVQCEGNFGGVCTSLRGLETLPRISRVASLKITADPSRPGRIKIEMLLDTFFLPSGSATGGGR